ncbi:methane/phenol/toluene hydroxylase [Caballeronia udeis]|uniref:Methane/phenol/toluene hydroxylase n=1 Tax=Caballeronia udeis TaxID=1232866 RepID=A0A158GKU7_9BURK|nr:aromatic/alkene monooxygenase hydroxylase subunit beta [Caballeronia udeis]SAL32030.1 methane/phenol/toluene hydroxylase [Caballeronia udeis]
MQVDIKSLSIKPLRNTFDQVARFTGTDKTASRYLEATIGVQPEANFHYKPLWAEGREIYDKRNTAIVMGEWDKLLDPRQYYYGSWAIARSRQQDAAERSFAFVEKREMLASTAPELRQKIIDIVLPLRHLEYAANLNNCYMSAYGYGASVTQATMMCAMDRLGIAQYITRIGLLLDGNSAESLRSAKCTWQSDAIWQPLRKLAETMLVTKDWFELLIAQNVVIDGLVYPLVYRSVSDALSAQGGSAFAMLTEFMSEWYDEHIRWSDNLVKVAAAESTENKTRIAGWVATWHEQALTALAPVAIKALGETGPSALEAASALLDARMNKVGL